MDRRLELHEKLMELVGNHNVYFQPPASVHITYPCVIYNLGNGDAKYADDMVYRYVNKYEVTFIFKNPSVDIIERALGTLPLCSVSRIYVADNLNHYVFNTYY